MSEYTATVTMSLQQYEELKQQIYDSERENMRLEEREEERNNLIKALRSKIEIVTEIVPETCSVVCAIKVPLDITMRLLEIGFPDIPKNLENIGVIYLVSDKYKKSWNTVGEYQKA